MSDNVPEVQGLRSRLDGLYREMERVIVGHARAIELVRRG